MIEKDRIIRSRLQQFLRLLDLTRDIKLIALEALGKPFATPLVVFEQENPDGVSIGVSVRQTEFAH